MHHPPFTTLIGHMDKIGLMSGIERLSAIVSRHPNVERIICGHLHRAIDVRFAGTIASTCPGPAHQVTLDLDPEGRVDVHDGAARVPGARVDGLGRRW